jgi:hypothetical protein
VNSFEISDDGSRLSVRAQFIDQISSLSNTGDAVTGLEDPRDPTSRLKQITHELKTWSL